MDDHSVDLLVDDHSAAPHVDDPLIGHHGVVDQLRSNSNGMYVPSADSKLPNCFGMSMGKSKDMVVGMVLDKMD